MEATGDPYSWLEDRHDPRVREFLEHQNKLSAAALSHRQNTFREIVHEFRTKQAALRSGYSYCLGDETYALHLGLDTGGPILTRTPAHGKTEILLHSKETTHPNDRRMIRILRRSPDGSILAWSIKSPHGGYNILFKDLLLNKIIPGRLASTTGEFAWLDHGRSLIYLLMSDSGGHTVLQHDVCDRTQLNDKVLLQRPQTGNETVLYKTRSSEYMVVGSTDFYTSELTLLDAESGRIVSQFSTEPEGITWVDHLKGFFYCKQGSPTEGYRIARKASFRPDEEWDELVPSRRDVGIGNVTVFDHFIAFERLANGSQGITIVDFRGADHEFIFLEDVYWASLDANPDPGSNEVRYSYSSLTSSDRHLTCKIQLRRSEVVSLRQTEQAAGDSTYHSQQLFAMANDGTRIPISMVYRRDCFSPPTNPMLLYAYGAYGKVSRPVFDPARCILLDRGFVYAIAHVRGGGDCGPLWHDQGRGTKKATCAQDFLCCVKFLSEQGHTNRNGMTALGGSAGGLTVGAALVEDPTLFRAAVLRVPFVDPLGELRAGGLTKSEIREWGDATTERIRQLIASYSPYERVTRQAYPDILVTTAWEDSQVPYYGPAKLVAKLQALNTSGSRVLLHTSWRSGHREASSTEYAAELTGLVYCFLLDAVGRL